MGAFTDRMTWYLARMSDDNRAANAVQYGLIAALAAAAAVKLVNGFSPPAKAAAKSPASSAAPADF